MIHSCGRTITRTSHLNLNQFTASGTQPLVPLLELLSTRRNIRVLLEEFLAYLSAILSRDTELGIQRRLDAFSQSKNELMVDREDDVVREAFVGDLVHQDNVLGSKLNKMDLSCPPWKYALTLAMIWSAGSMGSDGSIFARSVALALMPISAKPLRTFTMG